MSKSVLIIDDHKLVLDAISACLNAKADVAVKCAESRKAAFDLLKEHGPFDAILADLRMPGADGQLDLKTLVDANAGKPVVVLSGVATYIDLIAVKFFGVHSFMKKSMPASRMVACLERILADPEDVPEEMQLETATQMPQGLEGKLTLLECNLLCLIANGASNAAAADVMEANTTKVSNQLRSIYRKLGVRTRMQAVNALLNATM